MSPGNAGIQGHSPAYFVDLMRVNPYRRHPEPLPDNGIKMFAHERGQHLGVCDLKVGQYIFRGYSDGSDDHWAKNGSFSRFINSTNHRNWLLRKLFQCR